MVVGVTMVGVGLIEKHKENYWSGKNIVQFKVVPVNLDFYSSIYIIEI